jgi:hypothetical protein
MEHDAEARVCRCEDKDQHGQQNVGHGQGRKFIFVRCMNVIPGGDRNVEDEPKHRGRFATTMGTTVMEDLG